MARDDRSEPFAIIVPGIGDSGPDHWQTQWAQQHPGWRRVQQRDWDHPQRDAWMLGLEAAMVDVPEPPLLIAHSIGCLVVAHWAARTTTPVRAALLVAVPDPRAPAFPATAHGFDPLPAGPLRFPSLVLASRNDPFASIAFAQRCASQWGSRFVDVGALGHINAAGGLGDWPEGRKWLGKC